MSGNFINNPDVLRSHNGEKSRAPLQGEGTRTTESTTVYYWYFDNGATESNIPSYSQNMLSLHDTSTGSVESVISTVDGRTPVDLSDYQLASGKFRAIVKLFLLYEGQLTDEVSEDQATWAIATGWLVAGDLIVTAGHCAYDYAHGLGRLVKVKSYVGYTGKDSIGSEEVEFHYGTAVTTTTGWIDTDGGSEPHDVSFIKVSSPFKNVESYFKWDQTPISQNAANLGIVGYPGDIVNDKGERGAKMYKMFKHTDYSLDTAYSHMLQYQIDTNGGNSGSPVFNNSSSLRAIGVHVLGGYMYNSASVIAGPYGNRFQAYYNVAKTLNGDQPRDATQPDPKKRPWLWECHTTTTESDDDDPVKVGLKYTKKSALSVHASIPNTILDSDSTISFGSTAGPQMGVLASAAIAAAGRLAADSDSEADVAESLATTRPYDGILGRALLAEVALQSFFGMSSDQQETFTEVLGPTVAALKPFILRVAPKLLRGVLEPGLRLLLSNLATDLDTSTKRGTRADAAEMDTGFGRKLTENESVFLDGLMKQVDSKAVESFFSTLTTIGDVIGSAFKKAGPVLVDVAKVGLPLLLGAESGGLPPAETNLDPLAHRAILAEACLQAFIALPEKDRKKYRIYDNMIEKLKELGPKLMKASPFIVKFIGPVVADVIREIKEKSTPAH